MGWCRVATAWCIAAVVMAPSLGSAAPAAAEVQHVPLTWNAPPGCATAAAVLADVDRNLTAAGEGRAPFVAVVDVSEQPKGGWQAHLRVDARGGQVERQFEAESCEAIASATALIIALAARVGDVRQATDPGGLPERKQDDGPPPPPLYWQRAPLGLAVSGLVDGAIMPHVPAAGVEVAVGPSWIAPGWRLRLLAGASFFFPRTAEFAGANGDFWRLAVSVRGCVSAGVRFQVGLCAGGELSAMHSKGPYASGLADDTRYWLSPVASPLAVWNVRPRLAVFVRSDVTVPAWHPKFDSDGSAAVYTVPGIAVGGALGVELQFL